MPLRSPTTPERCLGLEVVWFQSAWYPMTAGASSLYRLRVRRAVLRTRVPQRPRGFRSRSAGPGFDLAIRVGVGGERLSSCQLESKGGQVHAGWAVRAHAGSHSRNDVEQTQSAIPSPTKADCAGIRPTDRTDDPTRAGDRILAVPRRRRRATELSLYRRDYGARWVGEDVDLHPGAREVFLHQQGMVSAEPANLVVRVQETRRPWVGTEPRLDDHGIGPLA